jgi:riboflavin kinase/FMN adenylyltransferase
MLFTEKEKDFIASKLGIPELVRLPFTRGLAELSPEEFIECLEERYFLQGVVIGEDFRFGKGRSGDARLMELLASRKGWEVAVVPPVVVGENKVSSSFIRTMVLAGDVVDAAELLGYPFFLSGRVVHGEGRGRELGIPTANLCMPSEKVVPDRGVYSGAVLTDSKLFPAAVNVGYNPTFEGQRALRVEAHLLDYEGDIYNKEIIIFFFRRMRNEMRFSDVKELLSRIKNDLSETRNDWDSWSGSLFEWLVRDGQEICTTG